MRIDTLCHLLNLKKTILGVMCNRHIYTDASLNAGPYVSIATILDVATKCYKLMPLIFYIHTHMKIFRKQIGTKNHVCNVLW